jgi:hypothetical protein
MGPWVGGAWPQGEGKAPKRWRALEDQHSYNADVQTDERPGQGVLANGPGMRCSVRRGKRSQDHHGHTTIGQTVDTHAHLDSACHAAGVEALNRDLTQ